MRDAVQDMVRKHKELTQKQRIESDSEDETSQELISDVIMTEDLSANKDPVTAKNPWMSANIRLKKTVQTKPKEIINKKVAHAPSESEDDLSDNQSDNGDSPSKKTKLSNVKSPSKNIKNVPSQSHDKESNIEEESSDEESESESDSEAEAEDISDLTIETIFSEAEKRKGAKKEKHSKKEERKSKAQNSRKKTKQDGISVKKTNTKTFKENLRNSGGKEMSEVISKEGAADGDSGESDVEKDEGLALTSTRRQNLEDFEGNFSMNRSINAVQ